MSHTSSYVLKRLHRLIKLSVSSKAIASSLLLGLLGTLGTQISTQPSSATAGSQAQPVSQINASAAQLLGQWQAKDPSSGKLVTLIFTPEDKLFIVLPPRDGSTIAIKMGYQVNLPAKPMQIDMIVSDNQTAATIFEFTPEGKLRLELEGISPGKPRPTAFTARATLFEKISNLTIVGQNVQVTELENEKGKAGSNVAEQYISILTKAQQAYYLKKGKFAADMEELSIITNSETEYYRYQMVRQGENGDRVMITAQAKTSELPSYTGTIFGSTINGKITTVAGICATNQPSTSPPTMPKPPNSGSLEIQCPPNSHLTR